MEYTGTSEDSPSKDGKRRSDSADAALERQVYEWCEAAYASGLSPEEIHTALQFPWGSNHHHPSTGRTTTGSQSSRKEPYWRLLARGVTLTLVTLFLTILTYIGVCVALNVNPLGGVFPSLQEMRCLVPTHPIIQEMVRPLANCAAVCLPLQGNTSPVIELQEIPSKSEFRKIAYLSKPIIVRGGGISNASAAVAFNFARLKGIFESEEGGVDTVTQECQFLPFRSPFSSLREAFDLISSESGSWDQPWYIGWSNCHPGVASKLRELFPRPSFLPEDSESSAIDWIFIGSPGLGAAMHVDYVKRPSWQAQLSGVKTWHLRPPPECEEPCPSPVVFTLRPGDLLFLETNLWYHQTHIEGHQLSISIGSEYD